jgi:hypothetical protein
VGLSYEILLYVCYNCLESAEEVNVYELSYLEGAASNIEGDGVGVTEDPPEVEETTTQSFLPPHPLVKESDKNSVPKAKGNERAIGNLTVYESPFKSNSTSMIISVYDIFGLHPHVKYIADKLADSTDSIVVIPDFFHGNPVEMENFPQPE